MEDPREILKAAGVECAEVDQYAAHPRLVRHPHGELTIDKDQADAAILALARRVAQYKWQRDECADELGRKLSADYQYRSAKPFVAYDVIVDLNRKWKEHDACHETRLPARCTCHESPELWCALHGAWNDRDHRLRTNWEHRDDPDA